jgi:hypothetical protein
VSQENKLSLEFSQEDWEFICNALEHAKYNARDALRYYSKTPEDADFFNKEIIKADELREQMQHKLESRKETVQ